MFSRSTQRQIIFIFDLDLDILRTSAGRVATDVWKKNNSKTTVNPLSRKTVKNSKHLEQISASKRPRMELSY